MLQSLSARGLPESIKRTAYSRPDDTRRSTLGQRTAFSREKIVGASDRDYTPEREAYFKHTGRQVTEQTIKERTVRQEQAMRLLGFDESEIEHAATNRPAIETEVSAHGAGADESATTTAPPDLGSREGTPGENSPGRPQSKEHNAGLTSPTLEDILTHKDQGAAAERAAKAQTVADKELRKRAFVRNGSQYLKASKC